MMIIRVALAAALALVSLAAPLASFGQQQSSNVARVGFWVPPLLLLSAGTGSLKLGIERFEVRQPSEFESAFAAMATERWR